MSKNGEAAQAWRPGQRLGWHLPLVGLALGGMIAGASLSIAQEQEPPGEEAPRKAMSSVGDAVKDGTGPSTTVNQFKVKADEITDRASLAAFAKSVNEDFDRLFGLESGWRVPIRIELYGTLGKDPGQQDSRTLIDYFAESRSFGLVLILKLPEGFSSRWLEREIVRMLLLELMLLGEDPERTSTGDLEVPFWLSVGVAEAIEHRSKGRPSELYSRLVRSRQVLPISQVLGSAEDNVTSDSLTQAVFRASAGALVAALLDQENGAQNLRRWLADLPLHGDNLTALFRQHFPGLRGGEASLAKWWALQVASMGQLQALEYFDVETTEKAIDEALQVRLPAQRGDEQDKGEGAIGRVLEWFSGDDEAAFTTGRLHDYERFVDHPAASLVLEQMRRSLEGVNVRGFPLYRAVVADYLVAVERLLKDETKGVDELLEGGDELREQIRAVMTRAEDYMNYMEATQVGERSGDFQEYRRALDQLRGQKPKPREDRISEHLDALEKEFR